MSYFKPFSPYKRTHKPDFKSVQSDASSTEDIAYKIRRARFASAMKTIDALPTGAETNPNSEPSS